MKKILIILSIVILCFLMAGCSEYCAYCKGLNTTTENIEVDGNNWTKVVCEGCGRTYYMKKLAGDLDFNIVY